MDASALISTRSNPQTGRLPRGHAGDESRINGGSLSRREIVAPLILLHVFSATLSTFRAEKWETIHCPTGSRPPADVDLICPESLRARCLRQRCDCTHAVAEQPSLCDHDSVVNTEPFVCRKDIPASFCGHDTHHFLQTFVA